MKSIYKIMIAVLLYITAGCDDILDTEPVNNLNGANFWETQADAVYVLNGIYDYLPTINEIYLDKVSDVAYENRGLSGYSAIERSEHTSETGEFNGQWDAAYRCIRAINFLIENVDQVLENDVNYTEDLNNRIKAEARFIRCFQYLRLIMFFGDVPLITATLEPSEASTVARTPASEVWDFIVSEFTAIADDLPESYSDSDIGRVTKGAALAMKARALLYAGRYSDAAVAAKTVIDLNVYSLYTSYADLFSYGAQGNSEIIFDRQYSKNVISNNFFFQNGALGMNGEGRMVITRNLLDAYNTINGLTISEDPAYDEYNPYSNRDPRLSATIFLPAFSDAIPGDLFYDGINDFDPRPGSGTADEIDLDFTRPKTGLGIKKYLQSEDFLDVSNCGTNFIFMRYADVLLMYAEAKLESNQIDESVYTALDEVRQRVFLPPLPRGKSESELREIIRNERMVELGMEGLRFYDIRRWRLAEDVMVGNIPGFRFIASGETEITEYDYLGTQRVFNADRDYLWPIPLSETILNPNLEQNDGY